MSRHSSTIVEEDAASAIIASIEAHRGVLTSSLATTTRSTRVRTSTSTTLESSSTALARVVKTTTSTAPQVSTTSASQPSVSSEAGGTAVAAAAQDTAATSSSTNGGAIAGAVAAVAVLLIFIGIVVVVVKKRKARAEQERIFAKSNRPDSAWTGGSYVQPKSDLGESKDADDMYPPQEVEHFHWRSPAASPAQPAFPAQFADYASMNASVVSLRSNAPLLSPALPSSALSTPAMEGPRFFTDSTPPPMYSNQLMTPASPSPPAQPSPAWAFRDAASPPDSPVRGASLQAQQAKKASLMLPHGDEADDRPVSTLSSVSAFPSPPSGPTAQKHESAIARPVSQYFSSSDAVPQVARAEDASPLSAMSFPATPTVATHSNTGHGSDWPAMPEDSMPHTPVDPIHSRRTSLLPFEGLGPIQPLSPMRPEPLTPITSSAVEQPASIAVTSDRRASTASLAMPREAEPAARRDSVFSVLDYRRSATPTLPKPFTSTPQGSGDWSFLDDILSKP